MQHGDALPKSIDPERPLSEKGIDDVRGIASFLRNADIVLDKIIHSGKKRAEETADIMSKALSCTNGISISDSINPNDDVSSFINNLDKNLEVMLVVSHLPFVNKLVSHLCCANENNAIVDYLPGSIVCIEGGEDVDWRICWMLRPELI